MADMKLIITDQLQKICRTIVNPICIPRVGEQVVWTYEPIPTVVSVIHDYDNQCIHVLLN